MLKRVLWIGIPLLLLGGLYVLAQARPVPVDVAVIARGAIRSFVEEEGRTRVPERFVVSAPVGGRLLRVDLEEGDAVEQGQVVARVDPLPMKSAIAEVEAQIRALRQRIAGVDTKTPKPEEIERAQVLENQASEALEVALRELERAKSDWERFQKDRVRAERLAEERLIPDAELDAAVAAEQSAHEQVRAQEVRIKIARLAISATHLNRTTLEARMGDFVWEQKAYEQQIQALDASLETLRDDLARAEIVAPTSGIVLRLLQESETVVLPGTPLLEIGELSHLEVEVDYLSEDAAHMRPGMPAEIYGRALGGRVLRGRIDRIRPSAFEKISSLGVEQQRVYVIIAFDPADTGLGDRFRVEARVILEERDDVVLVPEGALFRQGDAWHVFLVEGDAVRLARVETGLRNGRVREVREGLEPGARVVLHPGDALEDGTRIKILEVVGG
jgi:HlyD family secretion protein